MPDNRKKTAVDNEFEKARAARILQLSREWGVPTSAIYSQTDKNASGPYVAPGASQTFWTFDKQGNVARSVIDRNPLPIGQSNYTPEDIALQKRFPGRGMTVGQYQAMQGDTTGVNLMNARIPTTASAFRYGGLMGTQAHVTPLGSSNMTYRQGGSVQFREGSAFEDCTPYYTHDYSNGENGIGGIPPKVYDNGGKQKLKPTFSNLPANPNKADSAMYEGYFNSALRMLKEASPDAWNTQMVGMSIDQGRLPKGSKKAREAYIRDAAFREAGQRAAEQSAGVQQLNRLFGFEHGGQMGRFNEGSMFTDDTPHYNNSTFPPKVYNFGGAVNYFGPQTKVKNTNRPAQVQDYNSAFSANPFPKNYSTWDSPYAQNSYVDTFEMGGPITYNPTSYLDPNFEPTPIAESGIHIKPENRGKFTAAANRAGKGVQEYASQILANKENYSPTLVKRANFARNAAKWNRYGGNYPMAQFGEYLPFDPNAVSTPENPIYYEEENQGVLPINTPMQQQATNNTNRQNRGGFQTSMSLSTAAPIMLASAAIGQMTSRQDAARENATQKRRNVTQGPYYNPYSYGSGATNLYDNGGRIKRAKNVTLADAMDIIRQHGYDIEIE